MDSIFFSSPHLTFNSKHCNLFFSSSFPFASPLLSLPPSSCVHVCAVFVFPASSLPPRSKGHSPFARLRISVPLHTSVSSASKRPAFLVLTSEGDGAGVLDGIRLQWGWIGRPLKKIRWDKFVNSSGKQSQVSESRKPSHPTLFIRPAENMSSPDISSALSRTTPVFNLRVWVLIAIGIGILMAILLILVLWLSIRRKNKTEKGFDGTSQTEIPVVSKEINIDKGADAQSMHDSEVPFMPVHEKYTQMKNVALLAETRSVDVDAFSQCSSLYNIEKAGSSYSEDYNSSGPKRAGSSPYGYASASPLVGLPEMSHLGWGHWFTLRDLEFATSRFAKSNILGEGGYGVVYKGRLMNGTEVAVKKILNNVGQAEKEFRVEVEAIGHVRHKNLVRLLGYCVEGIHRMLVYEYVNNGNLEQWLHGAMSQHGVLSWESRMKILLGTAKALSYLHEAIDPKVVHRDIKSSNILIDTEFNSKVSDFGLAKLLDSDASHINTRVMGTYGYVAPEYANSGMLNEKSDIYSFGVVLLECVTARDPVDYSKPADESNLVEWLKMMVSTKRAEDVVDPSLEIKPPKRALKRAILVGLKCVDPDADKRPKMSHVVQMLEAVQKAYQEDLKKHSQMGSVDLESQQSLEELSNGADA